MNNPLMLFKYQGQVLMHGAGREHPRRERLS